VIPFVKIWFRVFIYWKHKIPMGNICGWKLLWRFISCDRLKTSKKSNENILKPGHGLKIRKAGRNSNEMLKFGKWFLGFVKI
jgi:hypothetical protein